ncbi:hypothetical protein LX32DRAFT_381985 [Colletotrichum zoysiae]|uniref:Uncharacterized protein n=1 Tax=Colletotrichum zoysiae TaxID=1216348 RepID=A0AAD9HJ12_9PEZI|nr:hypothetical protein LX32DRAFT_381985 [Colletotrichum zoysiae]
MCRLGSISAMEGRRRRVRPFALRFGHTALINALPAFPDSSVAGAHDSRVGWGGEPDVAYRGPFLPGGRGGARCRRPFRIYSLLSAFSGAAAVIMCKVPIETTRTADRVRVPARNDDDKPEGSSHLRCEYPNMSVFPIIQGPVETSHALSEMSPVDPGDVLWRKRCK